MFDAILRDARVEGVRVQFDEPPLRGYDNCEALAQECRVHPLKASLGGVEIMTDIALAVHEEFLAGPENAHPHGD
jgi:hypothetical protein